MIGISALSCFLSWLHPCSFIVVENSSTRDSPKRHLYDSTRTDKALKHCYCACVVVQPFLRDNFRASSMHWCARGATAPPHTPKFSLTTSLAGLSGPP